MKPRKRQTLKSVNSDPGLEWRSLDQADCKVMGVQYGRRKRRKEGEDEAGPRRVTRSNNMGGVSSRGLTSDRYVPNTVHLAFGFRV